MFRTIILASALAMCPALAAATQCTDAELAAASAPKPPPWPANLKIHEALVASPKSPVDIVVIGDSIAMMWHAPHWTKRALSVFNLGVSGDRAHNTLWRLSSDDWKPLNPRRVVVVLGTNNLAPNGPGRSCQVVADLKKVFARISELWPKAEIGVFEIFPRGKEFSERDGERREVNAELRKLQGPIVINAEAIACEFRQPCPYYLADNLHISPQGYEFLTDALIRAWPVP